MTSAVVDEVTPAPPVAEPARFGTGLHGHSFRAGVGVAALAEMIGMFVLAVAILGTAVAMSLGAPSAASAPVAIVIPLTAGLALALLAAAIGPISGAHLNPAVTVSLACTRRFPWNRVVPYVGAQIVGALAAALIVWWFYGPTAKSVAHLATPVPAPGVSLGRVFAVEAVAAFVLVFVIVAFADRGPRISRRRQSAPRSPSPS